jgi:hypothetical protein
MHLERNLLNVNYREVCLEQMRYRTRQAMCVQCNIEVRWRNHCSGGTAVRLNAIIVCQYSFLSYPARKVHAQYCIAVCGPSGSAILFHIISQKARVS